MLIDNIREWFFLHIFKLVPHNHHVKFQVFDCKFLSLRNQNPPDTGEAYFDVHAGSRGVLEFEHSAWGIIRYVDGLTSQTFSYIPKSFPILFIELICVSYSFLK